MGLSFSERFQDKGLYNKVLYKFIHLFTLLFALFVTLMTLCLLCTMRFFHVLLTPHILEEL